MTVVPGLPQAQAEQSLSCLAKSTPAGAELAEASAQRAELAR